MNNAGIHLLGRSGVSEQDALNNKVLDAMARMTGVLQRHESEIRALRQRVAGLEGERARALESKINPPLLSPRGRS